MVFVGSAGSESGARGFEAAYNAKTGKQVWRHYTVPAPNAPGSYLNGHHGGGDVWMNPTIDAQSGLLYIATGNAGSDFDARVRPGRNLWTDSIVALNVKTGKQVWGYQLEHYDVWDYDSASPPVLFPTKSGLAVGEANKGGFWHEVNAATGKRLTKPSPSSTSIGVIAKPGGPPVVSLAGRHRRLGVVAGAVQPPDRARLRLRPQCAGRIQVPKKPLKYKVGADYGATYEGSGSFTKKLPRASPARAPSPRSTSTPARSAGRRRSPRP